MKISPDICHQSWNLLLLVQMRRHPDEIWPHCALHIHDKFCTRILICLFSLIICCVIIFQLWICKVKVVWNLNIQEFGGTVDTLGGESILPPHVISLSCGILHNISIIFYCNNMCELLTSKNSEKPATISWGFIFSPYIMKWIWQMIVSTICESKYFL